MQPAVKQVAGLNSQLSGKLDKSGGTLTGALTLVAGTTTVAPLRLQSGTNLTTPVFGAVEFNGTNLFVTNNSGSPTRKTVAYTDSNITGNAATATSAATLTTARNINGQSFNGSADITIPLSAIGNVTLTSPTTGQVLTYNGTAWVNQTPSGGGTSPTTPPPSGGGTTITALSTSFDSGITPFTVGTGSGQTFTASGGVATGAFTAGSYVSIAGWTNSAQFVASGAYTASATATCPAGSGGAYTSVEFVFFKDTGSGWTEAARISFDSNTAAETTKTASFTQGASVQPIICQIIASNPNINYLIYDFTLTKTN